jgi:hypothetical protein
MAITYPDSTYKLHELKLRIVCCDRNGYTANAGEHLDISCATKGRHVEVV